MAYVYAARTATPQAPPNDAVGVTEIGVFIAAARIPCAT